MATLRVIHTSDLHNRLTREGADALARLRESTGALLLDSGDAVAAANVTVHRSEPVIELMNEAGYDAMVVGNREYYFRRRGMLHKTAAAHFAVLSANIVPRDGDDLGQIEPWRVFETEAGRVGVVGLSRVMVRPGSWAEVFSDLRFVPWRPVAAGALAELRERCDWLVALSHLGSSRDLELADLHPELDLVLSGHGHDAGHEFFAQGSGLVSRAGCMARAAAVIEIERTADGGRSIDWSLVDLP